MNGSGNNMAFAYAREILAAKDPFSRSPVLFSIGRVYKGVESFSKYVVALFGGPESSGECSYGELKRAVSEAFANITSSVIGNGAPPVIDRNLTAAEARTIASLVEKIRKSYPDSFTEQKWDSECRRWLKLAGREGGKGGVPLRKIGSVLLAAVLVGLICAFGLPLWQRSQIGQLKFPCPVRQRSEMVSATPSLQRRSEHVELWMRCPTCIGQGKVGLYTGRTVQLAMCRDCCGRGRVRWVRRDCDAPTKSKKE